MSGRSYLHRIALPLMSGEPALTPLRVPPAEEARPPAMQFEPSSIVQRRAAAGTSANVAKAALAEAAEPVRRTMPTARDTAATGRSDAPAVPSPAVSVAGIDWPAPSLPDVPAVSLPAVPAATVDPPASSHPHMSTFKPHSTAAPASSRAASDARMRAAPLLSADQESGVAIAPLTNLAPSSLRSPMPSSLQLSPPRSSVRIGTIEVRTRPASSFPPPPGQTAPPRPSPAVPSQPLSRGLAWRYGLVQG